MKNAATKEAKTTRAPKQALRQERADAVRRRLSIAIPEPRCELDFADPWQLLVATILSAQSTDKMVNKVTPGLFAKWSTPAALAAARPADVEAAVKQTGFFRMKAKAIREASRIVAEEFGGVVPKRMELLLRLPGVARKTANVVLGTAYRISTGVTVDTHVGRVSRRLQLTEHDDPGKVEQDLMQLFPKRAWIDAGHRFVLHGRYVCLARAPRCAACPIQELCPSAQAEPVGPWKKRAAEEGQRVASRGATTEADF